MSATRFVLFIAGFICGMQVYAQSPCTALGQNPGTAFPVCGTSVFNQTLVPLCGVHALTVPGCDNSVPYSDANPYWYKFTCYTSGTLGFVIKPVNGDDDYDWQLYDITGKSADAVFTDTAIVVTGNWSGSSGNTGASASGPPIIECASDPSVVDESTFAAMPKIIAGHQYLLLVSHYTDTQIGYSLTFGGGSASITDTTMPRLLSAEAPCDGSFIKIRLNKKVNCSSLAADGSDFVISATGNSVVSEASSLCTTGFDLNTLNVGFAQPLPPGNYTITIKNGNDQNTLVDFCENAIPAGEQLAFTVAPVVPTPMDSIAPIGCAPDAVTLFFKKSIRCSSIAADGSDFVISGPTNAASIGAAGTCDEDGTTQSITIKLNTPILREGNYQVKLVKGSDGNTLVDECGQETPEGSALNFTTSDTVAAAFSYQVLYGCKTDTVQLQQPGGDGINSWLWQFDSTHTSLLQHAEALYTDFTAQTIHLTVSNGVCTASATATVMLDNALHADFTFNDSLCPKDKALFKSTSTGNIVGYNWDFGDGTFSDQATPFEKNYPVTDQERSYSVSLAVQNNLGCRDTAVRSLKVLRNCYITVPTAFTPNGDAHNDFLFPLNAYKATNLQFRVFNRFGQMVYETREWTNKWDGTIGGRPQPSGTYAWTLTYTDKASGKKIFLKGTSVLIR